LPTRRRLLILGGPLFVVVAFGAVLAIQMLLVRSDLAGVPEDIPTLQEALLDGDATAARRTLARVSSSAGDAHGHSAGPVWWLGSKLPFVGPSLRTTRELVGTLDDLTTGPLTSLVSVADKLDPDTLVQDGAVRLDALMAARGPVTVASRQVTSLHERVRALPSNGLLGPVARARAEVVDKLRRLDSLLSGAAEAVRIGPDMLGAGGRRTYFVAFQNNAEIKGTGGLIGVYGILTADNGKVDLVRVGPNDDLRPFPVPVVDLGPEYDRNYGSLFPAALWSNGNSSPHFPYAGRIWAAQYQRQFGTPVDGVIAADPEMLSHLLRATGPVRLADGRLLSADNVAWLVEVDAYADFDGQRGKRKDFLREVAETAFRAGLTGTAPPRTLLAELGAAGATRHLQLWSARGTEMAGLRRAHLTGEIYRGRAPYAAAVLNNVSGAKLDYYLDRHVGFALGACDGPTRRGHLTVTLTNRVPPNLPTFAADRIDAPRGSYPVGQSRLQLTAYLTAGATITNVAVDDKPVEFTRGTELGHPRITLWVYPTPGQPRTLTVDTWEPARPEEPVVPVQPMARPQTTTVTWTPCRRP
jgi:hypothetical protein